MAEMEYFWRMIGGRGRKRKAEDAFHSDEAGESPEQEEEMPRKKIKAAKMETRSGAAAQTSSSSGGRGRKRKAEEAFHSDEARESPEQEEEMPRKKIKAAKMETRSDAAAQTSSSSGGRGKKRKAAFQSHEQEERLAKRVKVAETQRESDAAAQTSSSSGGRGRKRKAESEDQQEETTPHKRMKTSEVQHEGTSGEESAPVNSTSGGRGKKRKVAFHSDEQEERLAKPVKVAETQRESDAAAQTSSSSGGRGRKRKAESEDQQEETTPHKRMKTSEVQHEGTSGEESAPVNSSSGGRGKKRKVAFHSDEQEERLAKPVKVAETQRESDAAAQTSSSSGGRGRKRKAEDAFHSDEAGESPEQEEEMQRTKIKAAKMETRSDAAAQTSSSSGGRRRGRKRKGGRGRKKKAVQKSEDQQEETALTKEMKTSEVQHEGTSGGESAPVNSTSGKRRGRKRKMKKVKPVYPSYILDEVEDVSEPHLHEYEFGRKLGKGSFGTVYLATRKSDGKKVAIKRVCRRRLFQYAIVPGFPGQVMFEAYAMMKFKTPPLCPHIIEIYDHFSEGKYRYIVMEYMEHYVTLGKFIKQNNGRLSESVARQITMQLLLATMRCLECGIYNASIHQENVLVNPETLQVKLIDFGNTRGVGPPIRRGSTQGLKHCLAKPTDHWRVGHFDMTRTVRAVANLLVLMVNGYLSSRCKFVLPRLLPHVSPECRNLLTWMYRCGPENGPTQDMLFDHKWFCMK